MKFTFVLMTLIMTATLTLLRVLVDTTWRAEFPFGRQTMRLKIMLRSLTMSTLTMQGFYFPPQKAIWLWDTERITMTRLKQLQSLMQQTETICIEFTLTRMITIHMTRRSQPWLLALTKLSFGLSWASQIYRKRYLAITTFLETIFNTGELMKDTIIDELISIT